MDILFPIWLLPLWILLAPVALIALDWAGMPRPGDAQPPLRAGRAPPISAR